MAAGLGRGVVVGPRIPPPRQLLDRGDVDDPVVQVRLELGHVAGEEGPVGAHRVAGQRGLAPLRHVLPDVGKHLLLGVGQGGALGQLLGQPAGGVHLADEVTHLA